MKPSELFHKCAYDIAYQQVGDSVNYAFVEDEDTLVIYFQGSNSISDWFRNFLFPATPYKDMNVTYKVHRGFLAAWKEVKDIIIKKITEKVVVKVKNENEREKLVEEYKWKKIIVVGYSHGGALCSFATECAWYYRPDLRESGLIGLAFEAPRIYAGWKVKKELKERWNNLYVIRTNNDIVTHMPPRLFRFCNVGHLVKVKGDTSLVDKKWTPKCIKSHYPQVVYDALVKTEDALKNNFIVKLEEFK